jgi:hypothetical protein
MLKQAAHRVRGLGLPDDRVADELVAAPQQVRQTGLVGPQTKSGRAAQPSRSMTPA